MGFAQILSRAQVGLTAPEVRVEVHLGNGLPCFNIVGLAAPVVRESKERVRAALTQCGFEFPAGRITVNLAPADLPKEGGRFDLPIALGILIASEQAMPPADLARAEFYGELALTGELKRVNGMLLAALHASRQGREVFVPNGNLAELRLANALRATGLSSLAQFGAGLKDSNNAPFDSTSEALSADGIAVEQSVVTGVGDTAVSPTVDLADVRGQAQACRALVIAAAGGHSMLLCGPPGSGKSMLARRLVGLLPPLTSEQLIEVSTIAAAAQLPIDASLQRPFRAPHHTASAHAVVGGGQSIRPGEISLAHHGVLFLDELPEFDRRVLESLREPMESGTVAVVRANQREVFPARFQFIAAMNPCPCGHHGQFAPQCRCPETVIQRYRARISGPLLDRIDLQLELPAVDVDELIKPATTQEAGRYWHSSAVARVAVLHARDRQLQRQGVLNNALSPEATLEKARPDASAAQLLKRASKERGESARSQHRILRVARTIADLEQRDEVTQSDVAEALAMRWSG